MVAERSVNEQGVVEARVIARQLIVWTINSEITGELYNPEILQYIYTPVSISVDESLNERKEEDSTR